MKHKQFVESIPAEQLAMYAADNCHRRMGGNQEFIKAYVPLFDKNRLRHKRNLHNHGETGCDELKEPKKTLEHCRWLNQNLNGRIKSRAYLDQETSKPRLQQSCAARGYTDPKKNQNEISCDVWAGKKQDNCRDCRYF